MDDVILIDSPNSSRAYEADISLSESYGSVALSEAIGSDWSTRGGPPQRSFCPPSKLTTVKHQVELIRARGRIVQLESELSSERRGHKRARITEETSHTSQREEGERLHELEQERCKLLEELASKTSQLEATKIKLKEMSDKLTSVTQASDKERKRLQETVTEVKEQLLDSEGKREMLTCQLTEAKLGHSLLEIKQLDTLRETTQRSIESLQSRLNDAEKIKGQLQTSECRVKELERQLKTTRQDGYFVETVKTKMMAYNDLETKCKQLSEENSILTQSRDNEHLLRYKVQALQNKCERLVSLEGEVEKLKLENSELNNTLEREGWTQDTARASGGGATLALLQYRIAQLQNNEKSLIRKRGELETQCRLAEKEARLANQSLEEVKLQLAKEQEGSKVKDERLQRLEKRLLFVSKEREGCMNVLHSYKRDSGVDALLKESVTELEKQVERGNNRIAELEAELDQHKQD